VIKKCSVIDLCKETERCKENVNEGRGKESRLMKVRKKRTTVYQMHRFLAYVFVDDTARKRLGLRGETLLPRVERGARSEALAEDVLAEGVDGALTLPPSVLERRDREDSVELLERESFGLRKKGKCQYNWRKKGKQ
jgi:hypothetical protein